MKHDVQLDYYGLSDVGKTRSVNDDHFLIGELSKSLLVHRTSLFFGDDTRWPGRAQGQLLLVADGVGAGSASERASAMAVETAAQYVLNFMPWFFRLDGEYRDDLREELERTVETCQRKIRGFAKKRPELSGSGTALTMGYLLWPQLYVVHAGNTRCYLHRDESMEQVTTDHTMAEQLAVKTEDTSLRPLAEILWNTVGGSSDDLFLEVRRAELAPGDCVLFCTDGLTKHVPDEAIGEILAQGADAESVCQQLVGAATAAGGSDNITVVVGHFRSPAHDVAAGRELEAPLEATARRLSKTAPADQ